MGNKRELSGVSRKIEGEREAGGTLSVGDKTRGVTNAHGPNPLSLHQ